MRLLRAIKVFFFVLFAKDKYDVKRKKLIADDAIFNDKGHTISDGYHTFSELYTNRMLYNAAFAKMYVQYVIRNLPRGINPAALKFTAVKSLNHSDGTPCFGGKYFIVVITLPTGQISNHYKLEYFNYFDIPVVDIPPKWDEHNSMDVLLRLGNFCYNEDAFERGGLKLGR